MSNSVLIVGAGPAGGAAAVRLAQRGIKNVVLVDRDNFPRDKTCGSALSPNGVKLVQELGLGAEIDRLGYLIRSLILTTPGNRKMHFTTEQAAVVLLRKHFDNLLVERAKALGVEFRGQFQAMHLVEEAGRVRGVRSRKNDEVRADFTLFCDGAHSIFSIDPRPKRSISTLMGWWENFDFEPHTMEMVFDKNLSPLYGWMFPETTERVNIGICMDGEDASGKKTERNVRDVFQQFLDDHFKDRLARAKQIGKLKGHPIVYTTWVGHTHRPGALYTGEAARITHNATGEGIYQGMQSGVYAADAVADILEGKATEAEAARRFAWHARRRFTFGFFMGHVLRGALKTPLLDAISMAYNNPTVRRAATWAIGSAMAGSSLNHDDAANPQFTPPPSVNGHARAAAN